MNGRQLDVTFPGPYPKPGDSIDCDTSTTRRKATIVDGNKTVLSTQDGTTWDKVGLADANVNFYGVDSDGPEDVWISGGGMLFH